MTDFSASIRKDFPILRQTVYGHPLIYLDNAATTQMPEPVLQVMMEQVRKYEGNVHRGIHYLSEVSTMHMENARIQVQNFIHARLPEEIIFTSGTTDSINLAARSFSETFLFPGSEILVTAMEHHSNLIPWQEVCRRTGARCRVLPFTERGSLDMDDLLSAINEKTKLVAVCAVSNVLGTLNPLEDIIRAAHAYGVPVLVDAAQSVRHGITNVQELDCDFLAFSGHKICGPTGTGVLYGKKSLLECLKPVSYGGGMVSRVSQTEADFAETPLRFEAGTPNIVGNIGLGAAVEYVGERLNDIIQAENRLLQLTENGLKELDEVNILGNPVYRKGVISFNIKDMHAYDVAVLLDRLGIAVRSGHHCAQPLLQCFGVDSAVRVSPAFYNTEEEISQFLDALKRIISMRR